MSGRYSPAWRRVAYTACMMHLQRRTEGGGAAVTPSSAGGRRPDRPWRGELARTFAWGRLGALLGSRGRLSSRFGALLCCRGALYTMKFMLFLMETVVLDRPRGGPCVCFFPALAEAEEWLKWHWNTIRLHQRLVPGALQLPSTEHGWASATHLRPNTRAAEQGTSDGTPIGPNDSPPTEH